MNLKGKTGRVRYFAIVVCLLFAVESWAQNSAKTTVKVLENSSSKLRVQIIPGDFVAETVSRNKTSYVSVAVDGLGTSKIEGCPELPQFQALINIPVCDGMTFKVTKATEVTMPLHTSGYQMFPVQPSRSKSDKTPVVFVKNAKVYAQNRFWNPGEAKVEKLGVMRNTSIARLEMSPYSYNPVTGQMKKVTSMEIEITFKNPNVQATKNLYEKYNDVYAGNLQSVMLNSNVFEAKDAHVTGPLHYVIVSDIAFQSALQPFVTWKKKQGFIVTEAYTNNAAVGTTTTSIKAYLKGLYDNATTTLPAPTYVLFVGDIAQIPPFPGTTTNPSADHPTDLYYCTWTTGDNLPDAYYGRFSGTTAQHITNQVDKTLEYEKYLMADPSYLNNMMAIAGVDATYGPKYGDNQLNYVKNNYFTNPPYTVYSFPYASATQSTASASIRANINSGVSIANYSAHGDWNCWYDPSFTSTHVASLTNNGKYPVMMGNCCLSNKFNATGGDCFGEALLKAQNKGAVGYIGASNSTYWDEDYYFACGYRSYSLNVVGASTAYDATKLGSFDRLFHKNGEAYSAQYITTGQMLNAGNLAVVQSGSAKILYYLEIYHLMGDPSLMPYLGVPTTYTPSYPAILPLNSTTVAVTNIPPYAYVGVTMGTTLLGATFADATGVANVPLTGVTTPGTADIVITAQNKVPHFGTITVQTPTGPYVSMASNAVVDAVGNNNGAIDYNENATLSVTLKNMGVSVANAVQAKLTTTSSYIVMTDSLESYGAIAVNDSVAKASAFAFHVSNTIPDGTSVAFNLTITDNASHTWTSTITKTVNAPAFQIGNMVVNDATGNNNGRLDAGETVQVTIAGTNSGHAAASAVVGTLTTTTPGITITASPANIGAVSASGAANATFQIAVGASVPNPTTVVLDYHLGEGVYYAEKTFTSTTGLVSEDYETGDFTRFSWVSTGGNLPWTVVGTGQYEGAHCSKSGAISNSQTSVMQVTMTAAISDSISFYNKVSSESGYDYLKFYVDGVVKGSWSGEVDWQRVAYPVAAGSHIYKWVYSKDNSQVAGSDCAWVDYILFPPTPTPACAAPTALTATNILQTSATLGWASTATNFNVRYRAVGATTWITSTAATNTKSLAGLTANTQYQFQVQSVCSATAGDTSAWATAVTFSTLDICDAPTVLAASNITETTAILGWVSSATNFNVRYRLVGGTTWTVATANATSHAITGLTANTQYEFQVQAVCSSTIGDTSAWATVVNFTTLTPTACATPTALTATNILQTSATLGWTSAAANFNVRYRAVGTTTWIATTSSAITLAVTGLTANTQYEYQVQAVCSATAGDTSNWTYVGNFTTLITCNAPTALVVSAISESGATLNWTAGGTETTWNIRYKKAADATYTNVANTSIKPYVLTGLLSNTAYLWNVQAICSSVTSDWSIDNTFTTLNVGIQSNSLSSLSVYSFNDKVNVMNNGNVLVKEVVIYDMIGQEVGKYRINSTDNILINADLVTGSYMVKIITSQQMGTYKLFIKSSK